MSGDAHDFNKMETRAFIQYLFFNARTKRITGGKITTFNLGYSAFTVAYDGACSPNVSLRKA